MHWMANIIRLTLLALLLLTPWLFGGVWARVQWVLMLITAMLLAIDLLTRFGEDDRPNLLPAAWLPVLAGIVLGLFQLVPWPSALAPVLAPGAVQWRAELTPAEPVPGVANAPPARPPNPGPVSRTIYAVATREYLALLTLGFGVFTLASIHLVDRQTVLWFFAAMGSCGAALSFFGLVQRLSWNGKFYWVFEPLEGSVESFGPFVNRNNAGGFLNLCLAAGLGLLVWVHWVPMAWGRTSSSRGSRRDSRRSSRRRKMGRRAGDASPRDLTPDDRTAVADDAVSPATAERESIPSASDTEPSAAERDETSPILDVTPAAADEPLARAERRSRDRRSTSRQGRRRDDDGPAAHPADSFRFPLSSASDQVTVHQGVGA